MGAELAARTVPEVEVFENEDYGSLRVVERDGEPWFVTKDILTVLEVDRTAMRKLDKDEKGVYSIPTLGGNQTMSVVSEPGFYRLVLKSRKPVAKRFQRWVTHEVLPAIRRKGGYMAARPDETPEQIMARALVVAKDTMDRQARELEELRPKALFADAVGASDGTCLVGEFAKMLRQNGVPIGQNRLFERLRSEGYLGKSGSNRNVPTQRAMDMGLFRIKETAVTHSDGHVTVSRTAKLTGKGQRYFMDRYLGESLF